MNRILAVVIILLLGAIDPAAADEKRPNILWLSCEDLSPHHIGCYGGKNARTPNIDALARRGVRFTKVHTNAGVCAPSRTGIITGMMPTTLGANHMRSKANVPDFVKGFPAELRKTGFYCSNNVKTDYNLENFQAGWNESNKTAHWRNRPDKSQPFFAVFNFEGTHESKVFADAEQHASLTKNLKPGDRQDPGSLDVPPIFPDTPIIRRDQADLHELATEMDLWVATRLRELEQDGLLDNTIVFFWSDHGDGLPRHKRWLYDSGTHVPLVVAIPERFRIDGQGGIGTTDDRLISGLDFGPTVLNLAGVAVPPRMQGQPFLGANLPKPREYVYGARDRMDERYDLIRSVRDRRYLYLRNYTPWKPYNQPNEYGEQEASMQELRRLAATGSLPPQSAWFNLPAKPAEELYDCDADPWQQHNRIDDPALSDVRDRLRKEQDDWTLQTRDCHLLPEAILSVEGTAYGSRWSIFRGDAGRDRLAAIRHAAVVPDVSNLDSPDEAIRYWAVEHLGSRGELDPLVGRLKDRSPTVRIAAAAWLGRKGRADAALPVLIEELGGPNEWTVVAALTALDEMGDDARPALTALDSTVGKEENYPARLLKSLRERFARQK